MFTTNPQEFHHEPHHHHQTRLLRRHLRCEEGRQDHPIQGTPALVTVHADAPTIEAITALVSPQLADMERVGDAVLGAVIKAIQDAGDAQGTGGANITLDAQRIADVKSILPLVQAFASTNMALVAPAPKVGAMRDHIVTIALILLVVLLARLGVWRNNAAVLTMAGAALTGLFALIQASRPKN